MTDLRLSKRKRKEYTAEELFEIAAAEAQDAGMFRKKTQRAIKWYLGLIRKLAPTRITRSSFKEQERFKQAIRPGHMFAYVYDAKTKDDLPYWDKFPLVFPISPNEKGNGFYGLNLHYVPLQYRAKLLVTLYRTVSNLKYDQSTKLRLSYEYLKSLSASDKTLSMLAFKNYLADHVRSRFIYIYPDEWAVAMYLPMEQWQKQNFNSVYFDIESKIRAQQNKL